MEESRKFGKYAFVGGTKLATLLKINGNLQTFENFHEL